MNWDNVKVFLAVERAGTIAGASAELGIDESTVARRLKQLENALDARLFVTSSGIRKLSAFGEKILPSAEAMEAANNDIEAVSKSIVSHPSGTVRISATTMVAHHILMPEVAMFRRSYPGVTLELAVSNDIADLGRMEADLAIRMVRPREGDYTIRKICTIKYAAYAHRHSESNSQWIGFSENYTRMLDVKNLLEDFDGPPCVITNDPGLMLAAVLTGEVSAVLPTFVGSKHSELVPLESIPVRNRETWLVFRSDLKTSPNVRIAIQWIDACFRSATRLNIDDCE